MVNELIKITTNDKGVQVISAKELYDGLGLNKTHWNRWAKRNIEENEFFLENVDWIRFAIKANGNESSDYAITLRFGQHIAMMARTEKSHEYRDYLLQCEKQLIENKDKSLSIAREEIKELRSLVTDFNESIERAKRQFKPSHKRKLDYNKMIKAATSNDEEAQTVKDWVFGILQIEKWEDTSIEDSKKIIETITTVASLLGIKKIQQLSLFETNDINNGKEKD